MKILITGGTGFIGRPILDLALERGHQVVLLDHEGKEKIVHKNLSVFVGDIKDRRLIDKMIVGVDAVFHLALALPDDTSEFFRKNINGTLNLLKTSVEHKVKHFLFSSSQAVYGKALYTPVNEDHPLNPETRPVGPKLEYGLVKLIMEKLCLFYFHQHHLPVTVFRIGGGFGGKYTEFIKPSNLKYFEMAQENKQIVLRKNDGSNPIHVNDIAKIFLKSTFNKKIFGEIFNTSSFFIKDLEIVEFVCSRITTKSKVKILPSQNKTFRLDNTKIQKVLGFIPEYGKKEYLKDLEQYIKTLNI